ncbi:MAG: hypothetical protein V7782_05030 [Psychromonas sp.]
MFGLFRNKTKYWKLKDDFHGKIANFIGETSGFINGASIRRHDLSGDSVLTLSINNFVRLEWVCIYISNSGRNIATSRINVQEQVNNSDYCIAVTIEKKVATKLAGHGGICVLLVIDSTAKYSDIIPTKGSKLDICEAIS